MLAKNSYTRKYEANRMLGRLLAPDDFEWATVPPRDTSAPLLIHLSCNAHYTVFIPYLAQRILRLIGLDAFILGGPENCCGNPQRGRGDVDLEPKVAMAALNGFASMTPQSVLSICPDCDDNFNRFKKPSMAFQYNNISKLFIDHLDELRALMQPVRKRVVVHTHDFNEKRKIDSDRMIEVLSAIPGLEMLPATRAVGVGNHCQTTKPMPPDKQLAMFDEAEALGADAIVVPYHSCYRQHCKMQLTHDVETFHYIGLLATALGIEFDESLKRLRLLDDADAIVAALRPKIAAYGYDEGEVRQYVEQAIFV